MQAYWWKATRAVLPFLLALALAAGALLGVTAPAGAAGPASSYPLGAQLTTTPTKTATATPPAGGPVNGADALALVTPVPQQENLAIADVALVRIVATYKSVADPTQNPVYCTGLGVLVQSTDPTGQGQSYVLTTTAVLTDTAPCKQQTGLTNPVFNTAAVLLSRAYIGTQGSYPANLEMTIAPGHFLLLPQGNGVILAELTPPGNAKLHDYPTVQLAAGQLGQAQDLLDLSDSGGKTLSVNGPTAGVSLSSPDQAQQFLSPAFQPETGSTLPSKVSPGAPLLDSQGQVVGFVDPSNPQNAIPAPDPAMLTTLLLKHDTSCPNVANCLAAKWQSAVATYYQPSDPKKRDPKALDPITKNPTYTDFVGATDFQTAAQALTSGRSSSNTGAGTPSPSNFWDQASPQVKIALGVLVALLVLVILLTVWIYGRKVLRDRKKRQYRTPSGAYAGQQQPGSAAASYSVLPAAPPANPSLEPLAPAPTLPLAPTVPSVRQATPADPVQAASWQVLPTQPSALVLPPPDPRGAPAPAAAASPGERTVFCPDCGLPVPPSTMQCPRCGFALQEAVLRFTQTRQLPPTSPVPVGAGPGPLLTSGGPLPFQGEATPPGDRPAPPEEPPARKGPLTGVVLGGKYQLGSLLGQGGIGIVYQASNQLLKRQQAIKVLLEHHALDDKFRDRFLREAQTLAALDHPHILPVHDFGIEAERAYLVMPFISGGTLQQVLKRQAGPLPLEQTVRAMQHLAAALDEAHAQGVVHLDLKPANVLLHPDGRLLLSDFGLAHLLKEGAVAGGTSLQFGTPSYMAPEHLRGQPDWRSDLYALGVLLFHLLTGHLPFVGSTPEAVILKQVMDPPPPVRRLRPDLPPAVEGVLATALAKRPEDRYQRASALLLALQQALAPA